MAENQIPALEAGNGKHAKPNDKNSEKGGDDAPFLPVHPCGPQCQTPPDKRGWHGPVSMVGHCPVAYFVMGDRAIGIKTGADCKDRKKSTKPKVPASRNLQRSGPAFPCEGGADEKK